MLLVRSAAVGLAPNNSITHLLRASLVLKNDLWLAAQALEFNLVLATNDALERMRDVCADLMIENWAA
jgi:predicted nucleic acid-binding protein